MASLQADYQRALQEDKKNPVRYEQTLYTLLTRQGDTNEEILKTKESIF